MSPREAGPLPPPKLFTNPKSATLTWSLTRNRLCGLTSRCCSWYFEVHQIEHLGRLAQVAHQLAACDARLALLQASREHIVKVLIRQLPDDD